LLTLVVTPAALAARIWITLGLMNLLRLMRAAINPRVAGDRRLAKAAKRVAPSDLVYASPAPAAMAEVAPSINVFGKAAE
jgi:multidrug efflux pump